MAPDGASSSNIRVFISWHDQTVFAGEEVKCTITFKNVARPPGSSATPPRPSPLQSRHASSERLKVTSPRTSKPNAGLAPPPAARGHRSSLSLSVPSAAAASRARSGSIPWSPNAIEGRHNGHSHRRSVSILSIGSASTVDDDQGNANPANSNKPPRPARGHARASSLQIVSRSPQLSGPRSASHPQRPYSSQTSPLFHASFPPGRNSINGSSNGSTVPNTPGIGISTSSPRSGSDVLSEFKFPMASSPVADTPRSEGRPGDTLTSPTSTLGETTNLPVRPRDPVPTINEHVVAPAARILPATSIAGTPRSSGEFYSVSNNSSETLASEYVTQQPLRTHGRPPHLRRTSSLRNHGGVKLPEALMMGYAQIQGTFTLDGSLINLGPFEQVKRKAVTGGQGGGVVGIETNKRDSGLLRGFGWGSFTSSIGELLGGGELSSIKDMRGIAGSKSIPLLSTPQSILFVDLQLGPGDSKAFEYSFKLPKGLPPTHRGKAMKISYSLVIGTQRPGGTKEQTVTSVDVPFRVLGSVNSHGEILGHDLMSPYVLLRDQARVQSLDKGHHRRSTQIHVPKPPPPQPASTINSFLSYVEELLSRPRQGVGGSGLLSPTAMPSSRRPSTYSIFEDGLATATAKEAIDMAILRSNLTSAGQQSANRFEIARDGRRVGVVMLARPAYRLGEAINLVVDFAGAEVPCYAVHAALETSERVDPSLALRSEASVHRVTRKVFSSASEATLFTRRMVFNPTIPVSATPEFVTSGVNLEWKIRLEFVVPAHDERVAGLEREEREAEEGDEEGDGAEGKGLVRGESASHAQQSGPHPLLEEISRDDRGGLVLVAAENLFCESFEVAVPLRVYGAVCNGLERLERDEALEEGLVV
ncbi:Rgp1-domain-containing protein [Thozetella sp. PMI_491]|nr:Rgp1-domain-containing protein [Thozetella sp. PMI_491]